MLLLFASPAMCNPVSISFSPRVFQNGSLWAWWSWARSCSSSWWGSAGASAAHTAAVVTSAAPAVPSPAAVPGRVSDPVQAWHGSPLPLLLPGRTGGECANVASFALSTLLDSRTSSRGVKHLTYCSMHERSKLITNVILRGLPALAAVSASPKCHAPLPKLLSCQWVLRGQS